MKSTTIHLGAVLAFLALLPSSLEGEEVSVGSTGLTLTVPDGFREVEAPEGGLLLDVKEKDGKRRIGVLRFDSGATGQLMTDAFELRMKRRYKGFVLTSQERVTVRDTGAMCRTYKGTDGDDHLEVDAVIFVSRDLRLVLFSYGPAGTALELRASLLSLRPGAATVPDDPPEDPPPTPPSPGDDPATPPVEEPPPPEGAPPKPPKAPNPPQPPKTGKPLNLPGTSVSILPPAGWRGGRHAPTKGIRIVDPDRACIIDVAAVKPGNQDRGDRSVEKAANDFEKQLAQEPARWKRVENRRERVDGRNARVRRFEGAPGDLPCDFVLFVMRVGGHVLIARSIYPQVHRDRYRDLVLASVRSMARR